MTVSPDLILDRSVVKLRAVPAGAEACPGVRAHVLQALLPRRNFLGGIWETPAKGALLNPTYGSLKRDLIERVYVRT